MMMKETSYELLKDIQKKQLGKNNEAKMTLYNALPHKEYKRVFMYKAAKEVLHTLIITHQDNSQVKNCKIDLLTQEYEKFSISHKETTDSGFIRFNVIVTSLKSLETDYSSKNHVRKFLRALPLKWRAKNLFKKGNRFERENRFGNGGDRFDKGHGNRSKGVGSSRGKRNCYGCRSKNHFVDDCLKAKMKKAFFGGAWSDREDGDQMEKDATCLMAISLQKVNLNSSQLDNNVNELQNNYMNL
ncbi:hypothetical protein Tco_0581567 [Tanacetum coccineum]